MTKRFLSALLAVLMVISLIPVAALAEEGGTPTGGTTLPSESDNKITLTESVTLATNTTVEGKEIVPGSYCITVPNDVTLTLKNVTMKQNWASNHGMNSESKNQPCAIVVQKGGNLIIEGGKYESNLPRIITVNGNATISTAEFKVNIGDDTSFDSQPVIDVSGNGAMLTMPSGSITVEANSGKQDCAPCCVAAFLGAKVVLGDEATKTGPTFNGGFFTIAFNFTQAPVDVTINGGTYTSKYYAGGNVDYFNSVLYMSSAGTYNIHGGTFTASTGVPEGTNVAVLAPRYRNAKVNLNIDGGEFNGQTFIPENKKANGPTTDQSVIGQLTANITGGTFSSEPDEDYLAEGYEAVANSDGKYVVKEMETTLSVEGKTGNDILGKSATALQSITVGALDADTKTVKIEGTSKYVTEYTGFSSVPAEQEGNYIALVLKAVKGAATDSKNFAWVKNSAGTKWTKVPGEDFDIVLRINEYMKNGGKIEVALGENAPATTANGDYTLDISKMTLDGKPATATEPTMYGIGFQATKKGAYTKMHELGSDASQSDIDDNTMFARFIGLDNTKEYKVEFYKGTTKVYDSLKTASGNNNVIKNQTTATVYFTFNEQGGSHPEEGVTIAAGEYSAKLSVKNTAGAWTEVTDVTTPKTVKISAVKFNADGGTGSVPAKTYYEVGTEVTMPAAPTKDNNVFKGWKNGATTLAANAKYTTTATDATFVAQWEPIVAPEVSLYVATSTDLKLNDDANKAVGADQLNGEDLKVSYDAESNTFALTGISNYFEKFKGFSSNTAEQSGHYVALAVKKAGEGTVGIKDADKTFQFKDTADGYEFLVIRLENHKDPKSVTLTAKNGEVTQDYTIDLSGVTPRPKTEVVTGKDDDNNNIFVTTTTVAAENVQTDSQAGSTTATISAESGTNNIGKATVTLTEETVTALATTPATKADVAVIKTDVADVALPAAALDKIQTASSSATDKKVVIEITAKASNPETVANAIENTEDVGTVVDVTVKVDGNEVLASNVPGLTNALKNNPIEITFKSKFPAGTSIHMLYVSDDKKTAERVTKDPIIVGANGLVTVQATHLSVYAEVNAEKLSDKVPVSETIANTKPTITFTETAKGVGVLKVKNNTDTAKRYVVVISDKPTPAQADKYNLPTDTKIIGKGGSFETIVSDTVLLEVLEIATDEDLSDGRFSSIDAGDTYWTPVKDFKIPEGQG